MEKVFFSKLIAAAFGFAFFMCAVLSLRPHVATSAEAPEKADTDALANIKSEDEAKKKAAIERLCEQLKNSALSNDERRKIMKAFTGVQDPKILETCLGLLGNADLGENAATVLKSYPPSMAAEPLLTAMLATKPECWDDEAIKPPDRSKWRALKCCFVTVPGQQYSYDVDLTDRKTAPTKINKLKSQGLMEGGRYTINGDNHNYYCVVVPGTKDAGMYLIKNLPLGAITTITLTENMEAVWLEKPPEDIIKAFKAAVLTINKDTDIFDWGKPRDIGKRGFLDVHGSRDIYIAMPEDDQLKVKNGLQLLSAWPGEKPAVAQNSEVWITGDAKARTAEADKWRKQFAAKAPDNKAQDK